MAFTIVESSAIPSPVDEASNEIFSSLENDTGEVFVVTVDGTNLRFSPDTITLKEGDTVNFFWENQLLPHNAVEENGLFDSGDPERNVDYSYTFNIGKMELTNMCVSRMQIWEWLEQLSFSRFR